MSLDDIDKPEGLFTGLPNEPFPLWRAEPPKPQVLDADATKLKVLVYGPKGEALVYQVPRPVGFRLGGNR